MGLLGERGQTNTRPLISPGSDPCGLDCGGAAPASREQQRDFLGNDKVQLVIPFSLNKTQEVFITSFQRNIVN